MVRSKKTYVKDGAVGNENDMIATDIFTKEMVLTYTKLALSQKISTCLILVINDAICENISVYV